MNILVFPSTTQVGQEVLRSLEFEKGVNVYEASSDLTEEYGLFLPRVDDEDFHVLCAQLCDRLKIDWIIPCNEAALYALRGDARILMPKDTIEICNDKLLTYNTLSGIVRTPKIYGDGYNLEMPTEFPKFIKPMVGHSGIGCRLMINEDDLPGEGEMVIEYLPGKEYTVDCLTDHKGTLLFRWIRERAKIVGGIAVETNLHLEFSETQELMWNMAVSINFVLNLRGAWFFQVKLNDRGTPVLMEVGARIAGSSGIHRLNGVNLTALSRYVFLKQEISIRTSPITTSMHRTLEVKAPMPDFEHLYVDWDDCLLVNGKINHILLAFMYKCLGMGKSVTILTRNQNPNLGGHGVDVFYYVYVKPDLKKSTFILKGGLLIDDSFKERQDAPLSLSPDAVSSFL